MALIETFDTFADLDRSGRQCVTYGQTRANRIVPLGDPPRLTLGERLLGKYRRFHQVRTDWTRDTTTLDAVSSVGEMKLHVTLEATFRIDRNKAVDAILDGPDVQEMIMRPLAQSVRKLAKGYHPEQYKQFEDAAEAQLKLDCAAIARGGVFEIRDVEVTVTPDENVAIADEINLLVTTLQGRLVKAMHDDKQADVARLERTLNLMRSLQRDKHQETLDVGARAQDIQTAIRKLMDDDMSTDDPVLQSLRKQQANLVRQAESSYSRHDSGERSLEDKTPSGAIGDKSAPRDID